MKRAALVLLIIGLLLAVSAASAQRICGSGLPCGNVPWTLPVMPDLSSPTPAPPGSDTSASIATPAPINGGSTGPQVDIGPLNHQVGTLSGMLYATPITAQNADGSYNSPAMQATQQAQLTQQTGTFFGYVRGLGSVSFGVLSPLVSFAVLAFAVVLALKASTFIIPILVVLFGFFRKIVSAILDFIPL